jgi:4'-phosphopantetheinyl transferase
MTLRERWPAAPDSVTLLPGDIHVWSVSLERPESSLDALARTLSSDERDRASRFHFERDRRRFTCARGALRHILGSYIDADPIDVSFAYGPHGKPALARLAGERVSFNVSHSDELALIAVASGEIALGVDVEAIRSIPDGDDIARRFFAPAEVARMTVLEPATREGAFFRCWTRKEAYLKALGDGLAKPLDSFEVTFGADEPVELRVPGDPCEQTKWTLIALEPAMGFAAAIVATRGMRDVHSWRWTGTRETFAPVLAHGARKAL